MDELKDHIRKLREDFIRGALDEKDVLTEPSAQFAKWLGEAVQSNVPEAHAMTLATADRNGMPSARVVYLREFHDNQFVFYTNYRSRKSREIEKNSKVSCNFFWPQLERQIRIEGTISKAPSAQSDAYFKQRPYDSQIGAWASEQSADLQSRKELEEKILQLKSTFPEGEVKRPDFWGGLILSATYYEFWQGRKSRLHDRICYTQTAGAWKIKRLAP